MTIREYSEKFKTHKAVFDDFTERNLFKLSSQGCFDNLIGPLSVGKESNIFIAKKGEETRIIKIYRLSNCDFNRMFDYIKIDPRYSGLKGKKRKIIFTWAHREYRNLLKAREAGVRVPTPYSSLYNILVMEFIGNNKNAAPKTNKAIPENPKEFFKETIQQIKKLYKAGLVHADLSGFNILNHNEKPVLIDMSQTTTLNNPKAEEYLNRDIKNISNLFKKWGLNIKEENIKKKITQ